MSTLEEILMLAEMEGRRSREQQSVRRSAGIADSMGRSVGTLRETAEHREAQRAVVHGVPKRQTQLNN